MQVAYRQAPHQSFPYTPINTSVSTVRLLRLQRIPTGSIIGWLENFALKDQHTRFNAVSYVWGQKSYSNTVRINDYPFSVLDSLYSMLETLCDDESLSKCWWWIDSICINQGTDVEAETERNSQVAIMKQIYESAQMVLGWLGPGSDGGEEAIRFLHALRRNRKRLAAERYDEKGLGLELEDRESWKAVEKLLLRPWWIRVWTLQEYILPPLFMFYCGKESIDRDDLNPAVYAIYLCQKIDGSLVSRQAWEPAWSRRRLMAWYRNRFSMYLLGLMAYIGDYQATDPRDRIYSVLGLVHDRSIAGRPRYEDDVAKVYTDLVVNFVDHYNSLDIICLADRFNRDELNEHFRPGLPTWCPDWRAEIVPWVVPAMACQSSGKGTGNFRSAVSMLPERRAQDTALYAAGITKHPLKVKFSTDRSTLSCHGLYLDSVDGLGGLKADRRRVEEETERGEIHDYVQSTSSIHLPLLPETGSLTRGLKPGTASVIMENVMRCLMLDRMDRYLGVRIPRSNSHKLFRDLCLAALETPQEVDRQFLDWFQRNRQLCIQGYTLEEISRASEDVGSKSSGGLPDRETFLSRFNDTTQGMSRRLMTTKDGNTGMVPCRARSGDQIWALLGCSIPMVLRKTPDGVSFELVGECYLNGFMHGEALNLLRHPAHHGDSKIEDIQLT